MLTAALHMSLAAVQKSKQLRLTRKASMLAAAEAGVLPSTLEGVAQGAVMPGYVASITNDSVFVRCVGGRRSFPNLRAPSPACPTWFAP